MKNEILIQSPEQLKDKIYEIRGLQVMLDSDLAEIYGYSTKDFNRQVKNNIEKFDEDFMFQLNADEYKSFLRCKISTSKTETRGGRQYLPYVFTEQGVYMLMTVLKGELATKQSKTLVRLFKQMKDYVVENQQIVSQRDFLRLSLQTAENAENIAEFRKRLTEIDDKVENVVSNLGEMVRKSELSPIMFNLGKPEIPPGWLILNGQPVESDLAYQKIYTLANKSIFIVDNYISLKTLVLFKHARQNVAITIFSDNTNSGLHKVEFNDFCKEFPGLKIDLKQAGGRKVTTITLTEDTSVYKTLFAQLLKNKPLILK